MIERLLCAFAAALIASLPVQASPRFVATAVHVASGDTLTIDTGSARARCRLALVDAPAVGQPFGAAAKKALGNLVFNRRVLVEVLNDEPLLVRLEVDGRQVDELLLSRGLARVTPEYAGDARLNLLQAGSRAAGRGLWGAAGQTTP